MSEIYLSESYPEFFFRVTDHTILPYQERYARDWSSHKLLVVPTGLGKTDAVLMPWLYAQATQDSLAPRRLIFVLPRRNLTSQTASRARKLVESASLDSRIRVLELMGGNKDNDQELQPGEAAIIVATQDLYFSRALNRGYARRPPRWPIDFALYNQDCLIVLDEVQLMYEALATSTQLAAFRENYHTFGSAPCVWMSATVNPAWLNTADFPNKPTVIQLEDLDLRTELVEARYRARKRLAPAPEECRTPAGCAEFALARHRPGTRTLVIVNTVRRAREIFAALRKGYPGAILLHSRFRLHDREKAANSLGAEKDQIIVATQVLEAGVDITSRLLITDLAPWASLVQRFGRVNRYGTDEDAEIWWVDRPTSAKQKDWWAPYAEHEFKSAEARLQTLKSAAPADLPPEDGPEPYEHVLRRADLLDLFDTTADLSGNELDISRFIRASEDKNIYLAWREWPSNDAPEDIPDLEDAELCPVAMGEFRDFAKKHRTYTLNF